MDLHCLQKQDISGFSRTRVKVLVSGDLIHLVDFPSYFYKGYNFFVASCFAYLHIGKGPTLRRKNLLPRGATIFL